MKIQAAFAILVEVLLAIFGALAKLLHLKNKRKIKLTTIFQNCFIAGFIGIVIYFITVGFEFNGSLSFAIAGICGWLGPNVLDDIASVIKKQLKLPNNSNDNDSDS